MASSSTVPRQSAHERRTGVIEAAIAEFAIHGYSGASTEAIARRVGISQPYIFRLFSTKKDLFLAASDQVYANIISQFVQAADRADADGTPPMTAMEDAYKALLVRKEELSMLLQTFAAGADPEIQTHIRAKYREVIDAVAQRAETSPQAIFEFFATGMMLTVAAALDMPELSGPPTVLC